MPKVISLGGSTIVDEKGIPDAVFLRNFVRLIKSFQKGKFIIVCGGGTTARSYINALKKISNASARQLDLIGIEATKLNANLLRIAFGKFAYKEVVQDPTKKIKFKHVLVAGGWLPGRSTDYDAVLWAKTYNEKQIINITCVPMLYDKDPRENPDAKPIPKTTWKEFFKLIGSKWKPGMKAPFDPVASRLAYRNGMKLVLVGKDIKNLRNLLKGRKFRGSVVE